MLTGFIHQKQITRVLNVGVFHSWQIHNALLIIIAKECFSIYVNQLFIVLCPLSVRHVLDVSQVFSVKSGETDRKEACRREGQSL